MSLADSARRGAQASRLSASLTYAVLLVLLSGCGGGPELSPLPTDATILAFGDSLTYGTGAAPGASYPAALATMTGMKVINAGVPGEVSARGMQRLPAILSEHRPDLVVLVHGGNDTLRRLPEEATAANLLAMIEASRESDADVVMLGVPGRNLLLSAPDFYEDVAAQGDVPIDAGTLPRLLRDSAMKSDAVHLNAEGYRRMAEAVRDLLSDSGALAR